MAEITFDSKELVHYTEAMRLLDVSRPTIYAWIEKGRLRPFAIGRSRFLLRAEVEALARRREEEHGLGTEPPKPVTPS